jgi:hypothetical protein
LKVELSLSARLSETESRLSGSSISLCTVTVHHPRLSNVHRLRATNVNSCLFMDIKCGIIQGVAVVESCVTNGLYKMFRSKFVSLFPDILVRSKLTIHRRLDKFRTIDSSLNNNNNNNLTYLFLGDNTVDKFSHHF